MVAPQQRFDIIHSTGCHFKLLQQYPAQFFEHDLSGHQFMLAHDEPHDISAQSLRCKAAYQYNGIEENLHDTSRKTSSSVR